MCICPKTLRGRDIRKRFLCICPKALKGQYMDIAQAVDHQHTKDSGWQEFAKILHKGRFFLFFIKDGKRQEAREHRSCDI